MSQLSLTRESDYFHGPTDKDKEHTTAGTDESLGPLDEELVDEMEEELEWTRFPPNRDKVTITIRGVQVEVKQSDNPVKVALSYHVRRSWNAICAARDRHLGTDEQA